MLRLSGAIELLRKIERLLLLKGRHEGGVEDLLMVVLQLHVQLALLLL